MKAPFPYFGGKRRVADVVWQRFGDIKNYVEPFAGSLAVFLERPFNATDIATLNDIDGYIVNFWRAVQKEPETVAHYADWPVTELDLTARHLFLIEQKTHLVERLEVDMNYYDAKVAGLWVWGVSCWIGHGFCSGEGPWIVKDGKLVKRSTQEDAEGIDRKRPHLANAGKGVNRTEGIDRQRPHLSDPGQGVHRQLPHLGDPGKGVHKQNGNGASDAIEAAKAKTDALIEYMQALAARLRFARICCGDWKRVLTPSVTVRHGVTGVFLDPPYGDERRDKNLYSHDSLDMAQDVRRYCLENGDNPLLRIALCGYDGEHNELEEKGWSVYEWRAGGGYANQSTKRGENRHRERIWFSPHCVNMEVGLGFSDSEL